MDKNLFDILKNSGEETLEYEFGVQQDEIYDDEECEIVEVSENDMIALLDLKSDPLKISQKLFKEESSPLDFFTKEQRDTLFKTGFIVLENLVDEKLGRSFYSDAMGLVQTDELKKPHETQLTTLDIYRDTTARSDLIKWLHHGDQLSESMQQVMAIFENIQHDLSKFINLRGKSEYQLGYYQKEAHYERHRDSFPDDGTAFERRVTLVGYFNYDWTEGDGGELKVFYGQEQMIQPIGGRGILFLSGVVDHQVLTSHTNRIAFTSWMS
jgi:Rps23 Pro-64 3,4-dihydroxylase Tpa1-like proline 4-hydroxylase